MERKCGVCGIIKDINLFSKKGLTKTGIQKYNHHCKECHKIIAKEKYHNSNGLYLQKIREGKNKRKKIYRKQFIDFLQGKSCKDCGNNDTRVLEFDHLRDKKFNIGEGSNRMPIDKLMDEIKKCEIVCCNCHRIRTLSRINTTRM